MTIKSSINWNPYPYKGYLEKKWIANMRSDRFLNDVEIKKLYDIIMYVHEYLDCDMEFKLDFMKVSIDNHYAEVMIKHPKYDEFSTYNTFLQYLKRESDMECADFYSLIHIILKIHINNEEDITLLMTRIG